jgi:hypothetical protein
MRYASLSLIAVLLTLAACDDDKSPKPARQDAGGESIDKTPDAGGKTVDAGGPKTDTSTGLERPGKLPRPPKSGLPDDLRPPH